MGKKHLSLAERVKERDTCCVNCGSIENLEAHHIVPRNRDGKDISSNVVTLCRICHNKVPFKGDYEKMPVAVITKVLNKTQQIRKLVEKRFSNREIAQYFEIKGIEITDVYIRQMRHQLKRKKEVAKLEQFYEDHVGKT